MRLRQPITHASIKAALLAFACCLPAVAGIILLDGIIDRYALGKAEQALHGARDSLQEELSRLRHVIEHTAGNSFSNQVSDSLCLIRKREGLDLIMLIDADGKVISRACPSNIYGDHFRLYSPVPQALTLARPTSGLFNFEKQELARHDPMLSRRLGTSSGIDSDALALLAAAPASATRAKGGAVLGGIIVNGNMPFITMLHKAVLNKLGSRKGFIAIFSENICAATSAPAHPHPDGFSCNLPEDIAENTRVSVHPWRGQADIFDENSFISCVSLQDNNPETPTVLLMAGLPTNQFLPLKQKLGFCLGALIIAGFCLTYRSIRRQGSHL
jgi:hypothetical protein